MEGAHVIEVSDLVISSISKARSGCLGVINEKENEFPLLQRIRRMPFDADTDVYQPSVVSFGPYHHKTNCTIEMEKIKWESLIYILGLNPEKMMRDYLEAMAGLEQQIRSCYSGEIKIDSDELLKMMLLDGYFILCILYGTEEAAHDTWNSRGDNPAPTNEFDVSQHTGNNYRNNNGIPDSTYDRSQWYTTFFTHDLVLLENQIPFFVVKKIFELVTNENSPITVLLENVTKYMLDQLHPYLKVTPGSNQLYEFHHLLHFCHIYFKPNQIYVKISNPSSQLYQLHHELQSVNQGHQLLRLHRATELHKSGIEIIKREFGNENPHSLLDIGFCEGVVEMPCLTVDPNTYCLFRNLIAFEETCPRFGRHISTYVAFLSHLISMPEDVCLLTKKGIIMHQLDSDIEVSELFKMLSEAITIDFNSDCNYLNDICHAIEIYYQIQRPSWKDWLGLMSSKFSGWECESEPDHVPVKPSPEESV